MNEANRNHVVGVIATVLADLATLPADELRAEAGRIWWANNVPRSYQPAPEEMDRIDEAFEERWATGDLLKDVAIERLRLALGGEESTASGKAVQT